MKISEISNENFQKFQMKIFRNFEREFSEILKLNVQNFFFLV
jgi:hypothetical protein